MAGQSSSDTLLNLVGPELYRGNVFRISGLPVDATTREIRRRRKELNMAVELGTPLGGSSRLPLDPPPDAGTIREAFERCQDPERRIVDELFWFWGPDPSESGNGGADSELVQEHDLAVEAHCRALDLEYAARGRTPAGDGTDTQRDECWREALRRWAALAPRQGVWDWLTRRVADLDDPRLKPDLVDHMRETLPEAILKVNARLAVEAAERGDAAEAKRHVRLLRASPFERAVVDRVLRSAVEPTRESLNAACEPATPEAARRDGDVVGRRLLEQARPLLAVFDQILGQDHPSARTAHDQVARSLNACALARQGMTGTYTSSAWMLDEARSVAAGEDTRELIRSNHQVLKFNNIMDWCVKWCREGKVERAAAALRACRRRADHPEMIRQLDELLANPRALTASVRSAPFHGGCIPGPGLYFYGRRSPQADSYIATYYFTWIWLPLVPIASYLMSEQNGQRYFSARVPLGRGARWWRRIVVSWFVLYLAVVRTIAEADGTGWLGPLLAVGIAGAVAAAPFVRAAMLYRQVTSSDAPAEVS